MTFSGIRVFTSGLPLHFCVFLLSVEALQNPLMSKCVSENSCRLWTLSRMGRDLHAPNRVVLQRVPDASGHLSRRTRLWRHRLMTSSASARTRRRTTCGRATRPASTPRIRAATTAPTDRSRCSPLTPSSTPRLVAPRCWTWWRHTLHHVTSTTTTTTTTTTDVTCRRHGVTAPDRVTWPSLVPSIRLSLL